MRATPLRVGLESLRAHPLRTLLSTLGVVMGSASLSAVLALGDGAQALARQQIGREGLSRVTLEAVTADTVDGHRIPRASYPQFTEADAAAVAASIPGVHVVLETSGSSLTTTDGRRHAVLVRGSWVTGASGVAPTLLAGRWFDDDERRGDAALAVVTAPTARTLVGVEPDAAVGREIELGATRFAIIGVTADDPAARTLAAWVPLQGADAALVSVTPPRARVIHVDVQRPEETAGARLRLERLVQQRDDWRGRTRVASYGPERLRQMAQAVTILKWLLGTFASISLVVGGIGIMNVLLASVAERTREIGIRKAVGARWHDILLQLLAEAVVIAGAGAVLGVAIGLVTAHAATGVIRARTDVLLYAAVTAGSIIASAGTAIVVGLVFGVYPAVRAARLSPIDAIDRE